MSILLRRPLIASLVGALLALAIVAGVAYANTIGEPEQSFTGCLDLVTDRVTDIAVGDEPAFTECDDGYQEVSWKAEAVIVGTDGERGEPGEAGPPGTDGERGDIGPMGLIGPTGTPGAFGPVGAPGLSGARGADGRDGKDGAAGLAGTNGTDGTDGTDGNLIASGTGPPPPDSGNVGDLYLDDAEGRLFGPKTEAGWGSGLVLTGDSGNKILSGSGAPPGDFGGIGDMYLDEAAGDLYGPKGMLGWGTGFTLVGPPGSVVLSGSTPPDGSLGLTGDMYLDTAAGQLYGPKTDANGWGTALQITGADGNKILSAEQPPAVGDGEIGDLYLDRSTSELYGPKTAAGWGDALPLAGPPGATVRSGVGPPPVDIGNAGDFYIDTASPERFLHGPRSADAWPLGPTPLVGAAGTGVLSGSGPPAPALGRPGDFYIDIASPERFLYGPRNSDSWPVGPTRLVGPVGPPGLSGYQLLTKPQPILNNTFGYLNSDPCPSGTRVLGGGVKPSPALVQNNFTLTGSYPEGAFWIIGFDNRTGGTLNSEIYVICATVAP